MRPVAEAADITTGVHERVITGNIAARIDRLPLTRIQYLLAGVTQLYWGLIIDTDGIVGRLYPFVWEPLGMTTFQFSVMLAANIGAGILTGQYVGAPLADRFGRKKILVLSAVITGGFLWPIALTNSWGWLILWNFLYGIGMGFMLCTNVVYLHEIAPPGMRQRLAMRSQLITAVCSLFAGILGAVLVPDHWQWFVWILALAVGVVLIPLGLLVLPESPRWLEQKGRIEEADAIVSAWERKIEARTGKPLPEPARERNPVVQSKKVPVGELFRGTYGRRALLLLVVWILVYAGMIYGKTGYMPTYLHDHQWTASEIFIVYYVVSAPVKMLGFYLLSMSGERYERKNVLVLIGLVWASLTLMLLVFDAKAVVGTIVVLTSVFGSLFLFNAYNYTTTSFPTRFRSVGYSWTNGIAHTAAVWAPIMIAPLFSLTASQGHYGWIFWISVAGAIVPALVIAKWGMKQSNKTLEEMAE